MVLGLKSSGCNLQRLLVDLCNDILRLVDMKYAIWCAMNGVLLHLGHCIILHVLLRNGVKFLSLLLLHEHA